MSRSYFWTLLILMPVGIGVALYEGQLIWAVLLAFLDIRGFVLYYRARAKDRNRTSGDTHEPS